MLQQSSSFQVSFFGEEQQLLLDLPKNIDNATAISTNAMSREAVAQSEDTLCLVIHGTALYSCVSPCPSIEQTPNGHLPLSVSYAPSAFHTRSGPMLFLLVEPTGPDTCFAGPKRHLFRYLTNPPTLLWWFPFDHGILERLKQAIGLQVTKSYNGTGLWMQIFLEMDQVVSPFAMRSHQDAIALREIFASTLQSNDMSLKDAAATASLRISIVNHAGQKRSILNASAILKTLQDTFPWHQVVLHYFENSIFQEQVNFYSQLDVAVSSHGAQLTGIMFMPPCSAVLELFPDKYYMPLYMHHPWCSYSDWYTQIGTFRTATFLTLCCHLPLVWRTRSTIYALL